jgi:hypothetical protein
MVSIILFSPLSAMAGENMSAGEVLEEDSYVFTLEEANELKVRIEELEKKERQLEEYKILEGAYIEQIELYKDNLNIAKEKEDTLKDIISLQDNTIDKYKKNEKWNKAENIALFVGGIALTTATFIIVDKISDDMIDDTTIYSGVDASGKALIRF